MASITSVNARYSGTVTFTDQTKEYFHCQMEDDRLWSIDPTGSRAAEEIAKWTVDGNGYYPYYGRQNVMWRLGLPFLAWADLDTNVAPVTKTINGIVLHGEVSFALDDGTKWVSSMSYDPHYGYQWVNDGAIFPDNLVDYTTRIENMLLQILDFATLSIA